MTAYTCSTMHTNCSFFAAVSTSAHIARVLDTAIAAVSILVVLIIG